MSLSRKKSLLALLPIITSVVAAHAQVVQPFGFGAINNAPFGQTFQSNETATIQFVGTGTVPISITRGEYRINNGDRLSTNSSVKSGDKIRIRAIASNDCAKTTLATLTVGNYTTGFSITSEAPHPIAFDTVTVNTGLYSVTSNSQTIQGITTGVVITALGGAQYSINSGAYTSGIGIIKDGQSVQLKGTSSSIVGGTNSVALSVCNVRTPRNIFTTGTIIDDSISAQIDAPDLAITQIQLKDNAPSVVQGQPLLLAVTIANQWNVAATSKNPNGLYDTGFFQCSLLNANGQVVWDPVIKTSLGSGFASIDSGESVALITLLPTQTGWFATQDIRMVGIPSSTTGRTVTGPRSVACSINANNTYPEGTALQQRLSAQNPSLQNDSMRFDFNVVEAPTGRFQGTMENSIADIRLNLNTKINTVKQDGVKDLIIKIVQDIIIPIAIIVGILTALIGALTIVTSSDSKSTSKGAAYIGRGIAGIILMMSAYYLTDVLWGDILHNGLLDTVSGDTIAQQLYTKIAFPFIKLASYLVVGVMFVILVMHVFQYLGQDADTSRKKSMEFIIRNVVGILMILGATDIVEAIYGKRSDVVSGNTNLGNVWSGLFATKQIGFVYDVINRAMGLTAFFLLVIIVIQTYQMLVDPDDAAQLTKIRKTIMYAFIGIMIIGAGYLITNFVIIQ